MFHYLPLIGVEFELFLMQKSFYLQTLILLDFHFSSTTAENELFTFIAEEKTNLTELNLIVNNQQKLEISLISPLLSPVNDLCRFIQDEI